MVEEVTTPKEEKPAEEPTSEEGEDSDVKKEDGTQDIDETETKTKRRLTETELSEIKELLRTGKDQKEISEKYDISKDHLNKLAKKWYLRKKDLQKDKEDIDEAAVRKHVTQATTKLVQEEAILQLDKALDTGKQCIDKFRWKAALNGLELMNFLSTCVEFYIDYKPQVTQMKKDLDLQQNLIDLLVEKFSPQVQEQMRREDIRELALSQLLLTGKVQDDLLREYFRAYLHT
jgi:hypothetical protein